MAEATESKEGYPIIKELTSIRHGFFRKLFKLRDLVKIKCNPDSDGSTGNQPREYIERITRIYEETQCKGCGTDTYVVLSSGTKLPWHAVSRIQHANQ